MNECAFIAREVEKEQSLRMGSSFKFRLTQQLEGGSGVKAASVANYPFCFGRKEQMSAGAAV